MGLFGRKKTTVGLDIGSGLVKVAVIDHSKKQPELVKVAVVPLLADAIVEGEVMDPGIVAEAIQSALAAADVKGKQVVTAVGGRDVIIKKIQIERVKEQQARELMRWEAEQHVPFDMESVELDFQILDPDDDGVEMSVLLVAAKRELIESKLRVLTDAGLEPSMVDVDAFALHNAFEASYPDAMQGVVALTSVGHEVTTVNVLDDGVPVLTRDVAAGTRRVREDLQREHGLSAREAESLLRAGETTIGGRIPVNPSGGLACFGEAVPAQALAQVCELTWQLRGQAEGRQVEGARVGITANQGLFGHGSSVILSR